MRVKGSILADNIITGITGVNFTDGSSVYSNKAELNVSDNDFYLTSDNQGNPVLNLDNQFEGCLVRMDTDNSLANGIAENLTFSEEIYDLVKTGSGWFNAGVSSTNFTVPLGVNFIVCVIRILVATTGTPSTISELFGSTITVSVVRNGLGFPSGGTAHRQILNVGNTTISFTTGPLPVTVGDIITFSVSAAFPGSGITAVSVTAGNTYCGLYKTG